MLVVYFVNWGIASGQSLEWINTIGWRRMFLSETIPAALFGILLFFVPETPRYLSLPRVGMRRHLKYCPASMGQQGLKLLWTK
jgi:hypothetical protein